MSDTPHGYHLATITRGVFGEDSKLYEEIDEFADAIDQKNAIMALCELSDLIGAIKGWLAKNHPTITLDDLVVMADATHRAFEAGHRKPKA